MRISDWSSDVCSSDLLRPLRPQARAGQLHRRRRQAAVRHRVLVGADRQGRRTAQGREAVGAAEAAMPFLLPAPRGGVPKANALRAARAARFISRRPVAAAGVPAPVPAQPAPVLPPPAARAYASLAIGTESCRARVWRDW